MHLFQKGEKHMRYLIVVDMQKDFVDASCCAGVTPESHCVHWNR